MRECKESRTILSAGRELGTNAVEVKIQNTYVSFDMEIAVNRFFF